MIHTWKRYCEWVVLLWTFIYEIIIYYFLLKLVDLVHKELNITGKVLS